MAAPKPTHERFERLYDLGFSVIPLCARQKKAAMPWQGFQAQRATADEVAAWDADPRLLNVGVVTGNVSGNVVVLDIDGPDARTELVARYGPLPVTPTVKTGAGFHLYLRDETGALRNFVGKIEGVDLRANGGYVVGPGSVHPNGKLYGWEPGMSPSDLDYAPVPQCIYDLIAGGDRTDPPEEEGGLLAPVIKSRPRLGGGRLLAYVERALTDEVQKVATAEPGHRNHTLNAAAFSLAQFFGSEALTREGVETSLYTACMENGLIEEEGEASVRATIRSGFNAGVAQPRDLSAMVAPDMSIVRPLNGSVPDIHSPVPELRAVTLEQLLAEPYTPRGFILNPWLRVKDLAMVFAFRGCGKTWVSMGMALAASSGRPFLKWTNDNPVETLFIDGEMTHEALLERFAGMCKGGGYNPEGRLRIISSDMQEEFFPNIASPIGQLAIEKHLGDAKLVILDNLSSLCGSIVENDAEGWEPVQTWLLSLRRRGIAVVFFHHAGKGDQQRGTSKREDILDTTIQLARPKNYEAKEGARFEVHFTKARGLAGNAAEPFESQINVGDDGAVRWSTRDMGDVLTERIIDLNGAGLSQREIAAEIGLDVSNVNRRLKTAREAGLLPQRAAS